MSYQIDFRTPTTALVALMLVASVLAVAPVVVAAAAENEPNDTQETAMSITTGTTIDGELATSEDVNGDGDVTPGDATVLFNAVFDRNTAVTGNVALFDFNDDGSVTPGDATVLFDEIFG